MSVYPPQYIDKPIDKETLLKILESANWAPTHKLTEPWRFKIFQGDAKKKLGDFLSEPYRGSISQENFSLVKYEKMKANPVKASCVLAICMHRDPDERLPEWEELAAVAAAVQNIWISSSAYGIGGYWSSPPWIENLSQHVRLNDGEKCIGLFYMGYFEPMQTNRKRGDVNEKLTWIE